MAETYNFQDERIPPMENKMDRMLNEIRHTNQTVQAIYDREATFFEELYAVSHKLETLTERIRHLEDKLEGPRQDDEPDRD